MNQEVIKAIPSNRLQFFPVMMFATVMGLGGLTLVFERLNHVFLFSSIFATTFLIIATTLFFVILFTYFFKIIKYKEEVLKELNHPIRINFFAASSISMLILSAAFRVYSLDISLSFFFILGQFYIYFLHIILFDFG